MRYRYSNLCLNALSSDWVIHGGGGRGGSTTDQRYIHVKLNLYEKLSYNRATIMAFITHLNILTNINMHKSIMFYL